MASLKGMDVGRERMVSLPVFYMISLRTLLLENIPEVFRLRALSMKTNQYFEEVFNGKQ